MCLGNWLLEYSLNMKNEAKPGIKWQRNHIFEIYFAVYENIVKNIIFRSVFIDGAIFYIFRFFFFYYYFRFILCQTNNNKEGKCDVTLYMALVSIFHKMESIMMGKYDA